MNSEDFNVLPPKATPDLTFEDLWDDPPEDIPDRIVTEIEAEPEINDLQKEKQALKAEIEVLKAEKARLLAEETKPIKEAIEQMIQAGVKELEQKKNALEITIEQLERRRDKIREEMRTTFAGASQDLAIRVQGFKDYIVGSLQDIAASAEQLDIPKFQASAPGEKTRPGLDKPKYVPTPPVETPKTPSRQTESGGVGFQEQGKRIQSLLDRYRSRPDYYGPPWQLRRTFEPIHAERVQQWFFKQGGRGAIKSMGSRLQNILVASSVISILSELYGDRSRVLVLANSPERLGEWRRGLQDCLGISRSDFGPDRGVVLFESPEALIQKAERLVDEKEMPLIIIDDTEERLNFALLQFPMWLAFAPDQVQSSSSWY
ncbi:MAG: hypothetical protein N5P05_000133 [Chroococcopsis gigantea SAG 12.99]|jgi:hypothetical protein|nr:DUF3086 domain-containing protein [Chlorogloea purpurea SAG 13.99]MDV2998527.1 hypothetical protein [Chroococcopsis gigantea SAG 12.99]